MILQPRNSGLSACGRQHAQTGGASALVASVILAAAVALVSCAEKAASPAGGERDADALRPALLTPVADSAVADDYAGAITLGDAGAPTEEMARMSGAVSNGRAVAARELADAEGPGSPVSLMDEKKLKAGAKGPVKTWKRVEATPNTSRLMIGDKEELELKGLQANVRVDGFRARVVLDLFYFNDRDRQFEGTFKLRLPNEASPFMFAFGESVLVAGGKPDEPRFILDDAGQEVLTTEEIIRSRAETWENVKEARMVPKEKAALAYTETVRRRIDPALMEWSGAGVFNARVFPLSPKKLHRIVIGYDVDLLQVGDDLEYRLDLPSEVAHRVVDISIANLEGVEVLATARDGGDTLRAPTPGERGHDRAEGAFVSPEVRQGTRTDSAGGAESEHVPAAPRSRSNGRRRYRFDNPDSRTITARYTSPGTIMLVGEDKTGSYFATKFRPDLPKADAAGGSSHAVFMVDVSLSSNPERMNVWLKLMKAILDSNRDTLKNFAVLFFSVEAHWWNPTRKFAANTPQNVKAVLEYAEGLALEGATDLALAMREAARPSGLVWKDTPAPYDAFLLSDGSSTWGEADPAVLAKLARSGFAGSLFAYTTGFAGTDTRVLQHLARETGGAVFSVAGEAEVAAASTAHRSRPWVIAGTKVEQGKDMLLAGRPRAVFPDQTLLAVGRHVRTVPSGGPRPYPHVVLARDGKRTDVTVRAAHLLRSDLAPRIYGQVATGQLEEFHKLDEATEDAAAAYARHFRVTGQTCSLLMLESEEDYKRYDIKPEEDAFVVKSTKASELVAKAIAAIGDSLADAKKRFMAWVRKLEKMPGFELELPTALKMALEKMPRESFEVAPEPMHCTIRKWDDIPGDVQEMLVSKKLDYDKIVTEAARRLASERGHDRAEGAFVSPEARVRGTRTDSAHGAKSEHVPHASRKVSPYAADALKALSSLVENSPGDGVLARDVAYSAMEWGLGSQGYYLLRRVVDSRPWEPQTYHALAQVLGGMGKADLAICYYELALAGKWNSRFGEFRKIAALDYLRFLKSVVAGRGTRAERGHVPISGRTGNRHVSPDKTTVPDFAAARLESVAKEVGLEGADLMVTITWNTDSTDIDLHVKEPSGEECYYEHTQTKSGGRITQDVTEGYGPEMYVLKEAPKGEYHVRVKFFATNRSRASARTKVYVTVYRNWSRPTETVTRKVVTLIDGKEFQDVGRFAVKK